MWSKLRGVLTVLTNVLTFGRARGWWTQNHTIPKK